MPRTILLIGGNSGIGLATARILRQRGDHVLAAVRQPGPLESLGVSLLPSEPQEWQLTSLDGLVYFPGSICLKPFARLTREDFLEDYEVNLLGAVRSIQAALSALKASPQASVVLLSSVAVSQGMPFHASIAAAKAAVEGLTRSLAAEFAPKIRFNAVAPSLTDTPLAATLLNTEAKREAAASRHPLQRVASPEEIAGLVDFLLSDVASSLSGQVFHPDNGLSSIRRF